MGRILQQLENNEAVLLMYLADELPVGDRAEIDRLLAADAGLRAQLEQLRRAHEAFTEQMREADRQEPTPMNEAGAVRNVGRMIRQWQAERLARMPARPEEHKGLKYPWWAYPTAAAAAVLLAFLAWWGNTPAENWPGPPINQMAGTSGLFVTEEVADDNNGLTPIEVERVAEHLQQSFDNTDQLLAEIQQGGGLQEVEQELAGLSSGDADGRGLPINIQ